MSESAKNVTAYSLYSVQAKERTKVNPLENVYPRLPDKKYQIKNINDIIYISFRSNIYIIDVSV